jgi:hypothetical protein
LGIKLKEFNDKELAIIATCLYKVSNMYAGNVLWNKEELNRINEIAQQVTSLIKNEDVKRLIDVCV